VTGPEGDADLFEQRPQPARSVGVTLRQYGRLLNESLTRTGYLIATKAADPHIDDRLSTRDRQIGEIAFVATVEGFRPTAALRATCACRFAADREMGDFVPQLHLLDNEPGAKRQ
jgi:hypothetical protein